MTTTVHGATAQALYVIRTVHCPEFRPAKPVTGQITCTACNQRLNFTVFTNGATTGRCTTSGCLKWSELCPANG